jgi:hypothetical protein
VPLSNTILTEPPPGPRHSRLSDAVRADFWFGRAGFVFSQHIKVNSPSFTLNPYTSGNQSVDHANLLQGFDLPGITQHPRQKNNLKVTDLQFKLR